MTHIISNWYIYIISFFIGAIPFGYIIVKLTKGIDLRYVGSGNVGATNVYRVAGKIPAVITLLLDVLKGVVCVCLAKTVSHDSIVWILCGILAVLGHGFTPFLKFKGGKSVATSLGTTLALLPLPIIILLPIFLYIVYLTKYVSLGSIVSAFLLPFITLAFKYPPSLEIFSIFIAVFVILKHIPNIKRLIKGKENKIFLKT